MTPAPPGTAAEALSGLARRRPDGWLANPMPANADTLLRIASEALEREHPGAGGAPRLVASRYTAAVFTVGTPPGRVLKLHADPEAYAAESLAYDLLAGVAPIPLLHSEGPESLSLLLEYLPQAADWAHPSTPGALADCVAAVHTAASRLPSQVAALMAPFTLARLVEEPAPAWIAEPSAWGEVLGAHLDVHGPDHLILGHLDLKPEHLRTRADQTTVLLDVETVRPDVTGLIDLVTLPAIYRQAGHELSTDRVLGLYRDAVAAYGADWTLPALRGALRAYAAATGLESLHGLDQ